MRRFNFTLILRLALVGLVVFLVLYPLTMLFFGSFRDNMPGLPGEYTFDGYMEVYSDPETYDVIWTTIQIAFGSTVLTVALGVFLCWLIHRTDAPGRGLINTVLHLNLFLLAPLPMLLGWTFLLAPKSGIINNFYASIFGESLFDIFSVSGIVFTGVSFSFSFIYVFLSPAFKSMDISLEEAAKTSGASTFSTLRRVTLPLLLPAITATMMLAFVRGMESFEGALILGAPSGINTIATKIFEYLNWEPPNFPAGMALGVTLLLIIFLLVLVQWGVLGQREYTTVTGKGYRPRPMNIGKWRWPLFTLAILIIAGLTIPPMFILIQSTFMKSAGLYVGDFYTLKNYVKAFSNPHVMLALKNTIILGTVSATAGVFIYMLVSYVVVITRFREKKTLDLVSWIPWAVPPIVLSLGLLWAYILLPLPFGIKIYGTMMILIIAMIVRNLPIGTKLIGATMIQVSKEMEESARVSGASWLKTLFRIWVPILKNGMATAWLLAFAFSVRDLSSVILLYSTDTRVLTTVFFDLYQQGELEAASVVGLMQGMLIVSAYVLMRLLARGGIKEMAAT